MGTFPDILQNHPGLTEIRVPDLWQQEAIKGLRDGFDVVVHAPTGSGKTFIFEHWSHNGKPKGRAIYTVPTRALANDKLAEWRALGWNVGIATGDLAENLDAPIIVATLETQKNRLVQGDGPDLLVIDEYQMIGDESRGLNYEVSMALAPEKTQLLLLSGSVGNPGHVVRWLERIGRQARLVSHNERSVPLEEVHPMHFSISTPSDLKTYWGRFVGKALAADLGPILIFSPRRQAAESLAQEIASQLPNPNPLELTNEQRHLVGHKMERLLKSRVAYHHSGLSYAVRAGVVEPLAKAGQLRVVIATMGLAAGINFSLKSVAIAGDSYRRNHLEHPIQPDELLQMFGRAGRRGIDETGYALVSANQLGLQHAFPAFLSRSKLVDWGALFGVMASAVELGKNPYEEAVRIQTRLFTTRPIHLGVEESMKFPNAPCGLKTDQERARYVRKKTREFLNSRGEWEIAPRSSEIALKEVWRMVKAPETMPKDHILIPFLSDPNLVEKYCSGIPVRIGKSGSHDLYHSRQVIAEVLASDKVTLSKWTQRMTGWKHRQVSKKRWNTMVLKLLHERLATRGTPIVQVQESNGKISIIINIEELRTMAIVDRHGLALYKPEVRHVFPTECNTCPQAEICKAAPAHGVVEQWRRLKLIDNEGQPTSRGRIVSFFTKGVGLAIAAAVEASSYDLEELIYDLANLDAGFRFAEEENRWAGRLAYVCRETYGMIHCPGYLENGIPPAYGSGAERVVAAIHKDPNCKQEWVTPTTGAGDIDRIIIEWRSLLRRIAHAPVMENSRWTELQARSRAILHEIESPTCMELPRLPYHQTRRINHRLNFRR